MNPPRDPLDLLLDRWSKLPEPTSRLTTEVWQRISNSEENVTSTTGWWPSVDAWFARPSFAVMFIASCALLGLFVAEVRVNRVERERGEQLARSYLQLIDPLITAQTGESRQ